MASGLLPWRWGGGCGMVSDVEMMLFPGKKSEKMKGACGQISGEDYKAWGAAVYVRDFKEYLV